MGYLDLTPVRYLERTKCPFFGFTQVGNLFIDTGVGNDRCALVRGSDCSCLMLKSDLVPDWNSCMNNSENFSLALERMMRDCEILADEFIEDEQEDRTGLPHVPFSFWYSYITDK